MVLNKKILSLISSYALIANLTSSKPVSSHFDLKDVSGFAYYASYGIPYGAIAEPVLVGLPTAAITAYKSVKEKPVNKRKFKKILKNAANKSFKMIKWLSPIPIGLRMYQILTPAPRGQCECYKLNYIADIGAAVTIGGLSWIGQKLTEDKDKTQKNDEPKIANSNEKEIAK